MYVEHESAPGRLPPAQATPLLPRGRGLSAIFTGEQSPFFLRVRRKLHSFLSEAEGKKEAAAAFKSGRPQSRWRRSF